MRDAQQPSPFQEPNDIFRYTIEELRSYATSDEAAEFHPIPGSREVTLSIRKEAPSDVTVHDKEGAKGGKKRCKQRPQWVTTAADYDGSDDEKAGGSAMGRVTTGPCNRKS
jgi:hypothetical protein